MNHVLPIWKWLSPNWSIRCQVYPYCTIRSTPEKPVPVAEFATARSIGLLTTSSLWSQRWNKRWMQKVSGKPLAFSTGLKHLKKPAGFDKQAVPATQPPLHPIIPEALPHMGEESLRSVLRS